MAHLILWTVALIANKYSKKAVDYEAATYPPFSGRYWLACLGYLYLLLLGLLLLLALTSLGMGLVKSFQLSYLAFGLVYLVLLYLYGSTLFAYSCKLYRDTRYYLARR